MFGEEKEIVRIRVIEENTQQLGIPLLVLMENAGKCVADLVNELSDKKEKVCILAGKGGNGGDAFVSARHLLSYGYDVTILELYEKEKVSHPDAIRNMQVLTSMGARIIFSPSMETIAEELGKCKIIIDGLLGTGIKPPIRSPLREAIELINNSNAIKISIDVPSGVNPDTGEVPDIAVHADFTVAMHYLKKGYRKAQNYVGEIRLCNIGIPDIAEKIVGTGNLRFLVKHKDMDSKKGDGGRVYVIGGSKYYTGAPALSGMAALASGADLAFIIVPSSIRNIVASYSPSLITFGIGEEFLYEDSVEKIIEYIKKPTAIVVGPGLGLYNSIKDFIGKLIINLQEKFDAPLIIDADALKVLPDLNIRFGGKAILTPHRGEFAYMIERIFDRKIEGIEQDAKELAGYFDAILLVKGPHDIICNSNQCYINKTGQPGMSTGGTGDVLTGIIASMVSRTPTLLDAASIAAYINGKTGEELLREKGEFITSQDLLQYIPRIIHASTTRKI